jgi:ABC-2 type transport system permease protein/lipopolysaccharide transport system permease protein
MKRWWDLLVVLTERILKARYRGSVLGIFWSLMNPLLMTGVYTAIFGYAFRQYYAGSVLHYALVVFIGLTVIQFFGGSTSQALSSIVVNSGLLNKIRVPFEIFPASTVASHAVQLGIGVLPLLIGVTLFATHDVVRALLLPLPLVGLVLLSAGVSYLMSTIYVYFRDIPHIYELITFFAWVTLPVFYPAAIVPLRVRHLLSLNPLFPTVQSLRDLALGNGPLDLLAIAASLGIGALGLAGGLLVFTWRRREFMDLI